MNQYLQTLSEIGIVPVIKITDVSQAVPLAKALMDGGIPCAEVTFRTPQAAEAIAKMSQAYPDMILGAGTITTTDQVDAALAAGVKFVVSPGLNPRIVSYCIEKNLLIIPGCSCPSDIERAMELGLTNVKFFPAEQSGGTAAIAAMSAPYVGVKFMPTGGVNEKNILSYLNLPCVMACGGSWMVPQALLEAGDYDAITRLSKAAVQTVLGFSLAHVGINAENETEGAAIASLFSASFGLEIKNGNSSIFAGTAVEVMKTPYLGEKGHIGFYTHSVERAKRFLSAQGFTFNPDTEKKAPDGRIQVVYLKESFGGFAVHLIRKS